MNKCPARKGAWGQVGGACPKFPAIGTGPPTADNTHEVAQHVDPSSRIVHVDNDPLVLVHANALLTSAPEGVTAYVDADVRDPGAILRQAAGTPDFGRPVAITMLGILNFVMDTDDTVSVVRRLMDAVPSGSHLVVSHPTTEVDGEVMTQAVEYWNSQGSASTSLRSRAELVRFLDGVDVLLPGVVSCSRRRPDEAEAEAVDVTHFGGVGRKRWTAGREQGTGAVRRTGVAGPCPSGWRRAGSGRTTEGNGDRVEVPSSPQEEP